MKRQILTAAAVLALSAPAFADDAPAVKEIDVTFDITAIESPTAAEFWGQLEGDLETAILKRITGQIADEGAEVTIDVDEFDMSSTFQAALGADSTLTGDVAIKSMIDSTVDTFYTLTITLRDAGILTEQDGQIVATSIPLDEAYAAMINTFADNVAEKLK